MSQHLLQAFHELASKDAHLLIVGDLILDHYVHGDVGRASPEAPIVVFDASRSESRLGGALNVAANLRDLGVRSCAAGVIGDDGYGRLLTELLEARGVDVEGLIVDPKRPTTVKTRHVASGHQQVLRVDHEWKSPLEVEIERQLCAYLEQHLKRFSGVIVSDYGKGVLTKNVLQLIVRLAREAQIPVLVDPKGQDYTIYSGATLITPNRKEAELAVGFSLSDRDEIRRAGDRLIEIADLSSIVITLGADGVYFKTREGHERFVPTEARSVFDVTGAGDTVISVLAWAVASGLSLDDAVPLANCGAGIVVERFGAATVTREQMLARLTPTGVRHGKVVQREDVHTLVNELRAAGEEIAFTNGCFDLIHPGHVTYLQRAREQADVLIVGVNTDASIKRQGKGEERPICPLEDRMTVLAALEMVDYVVPFDEDTPLNLIEAITPDVLIKGEDWAGNVVGSEHVESHGGRVFLVPLVEGRSTTGIVERIRKAFAPRS